MFVESNNKTMRPVFSITFSFHISNNSFVLNFTEVSWSVADWKLKIKQTKPWLTHYRQFEKLRSRLSRGRKTFCKGSHSKYYRFLGHAVSAIPTQLCCYSQKNERSFVLIQLSLSLQKQEQWFADPQSRG